MIYPDNFEQKTEFDIIREMIRDKCLSEQGKKYAEKIRFTSDIELLEKWLDQTAEFKQLLADHPDFPQQDYFDLRPELERIRIPGSHMEPEKLFDLKTSLSTILDVSAYFNKARKESIPTLREISDQVTVEKAIPARIEKLMDERGQIRDGASETLKKIRKNIRGKLSAADRQIYQTLKSAKQSGWVAPDAEVTIRDGRPVIPLPVTHKRRIRGFILDESASGQTVYIEPGEVMEINNEIRELKSAERREIINILKDLSDFLRPHIPDLTEAYRLTGLIDFIRAKALIAARIHGIKPVMHSHPLIDWKKGMHPLLYLHHQKIGKNTVPLNIRLDSENRILVISGPNAGGKSVCLKTVALLQYMLQCGILIPVAEDSEAGIFDNMFIDIGDEQSLENDLSTYSSHLLNLKHFLLHSDEKSIFFIDEFGAGTEPQLGGAIAEAILEKLNSKKVFGLVTTHYANLKVMAREGSGIVNGAMLFDTRKIEPLYELRMGQPGSSFAFEIARKIGFPGNILTLAEKKTGRKQLDFEQQLQQLDIDKKELQKKQTEVHLADSFLSEMIDKYENLLHELESNKKEILQNARQEASDLIESSNKLIENTIREIKEAQAEKLKTKELRQKVEKKAEELQAKKKKETSRKRKEKKQKK